MRRWLLWLLVLFGCGLLIGVGGAAYYFFGDDSHAQAMFHVGSESPVVLSRGEPLSERDFQRLRATQMAAMKSYYVLNAALANSNVAHIALAHDTPAGATEDNLSWLADALSVRFPGDGEYMSVELQLPGASPEDNVKMLDAIVRAYQSEVVDMERARQRATQEVLAAASRRVNEQLARETERYLELAKDLDKSTGPNDLRDRLLVDKINLYEREYLDLTRRLSDLGAEAAQRVAVAGKNSNGETTKAEPQGSGPAEEATGEAAKIDDLSNHERIAMMFMTQRLKTVTDDIAKMTEELANRSKQNPQLQVMQEQLELLRETARKVWQAREDHQVELSNPQDRIQLVQPAQWIETSRWNRKP
jgi:hypothetical protein